MAQNIFTDVAATTLAAAISTTPAVGTSESWHVTSSAAPLPQPTTGQQYYATVGPSSDTNPEIVAVVGIVDSTHVTVLRGQGTNTVVKTHASGDLFTHTVTAGALNTIATVATTQAPLDGSTLIATDEYADDAVAVETTRAENAEALLVTGGVDVSVAGVLSATTNVEAIIDSRSPNQLAAITGNLNFGGFKAVGLADGAASGEAVAFDQLSGLLAGPLTGDVTTSGAVSTFAGTVNSQAIVRASLSQDVAERAGIAGTGAVPTGSLNNGIRSGVIDAVLGDSTGRGDGGTPGVTDWATLVATTENRANGLADPLHGFIIPNSPADMYGWSKLTAGSASSIGAPSGQTSSWLLGATGNVAGDGATTFGCNTATSTAVAANTGTFPLVVGCAVSGSGVKSGSVVLAMNSAKTSITLSLPTTSTLTNTTLTFTRPFRRVQLFYMKQSTGAAVTFATTGAPSLVVSSGSLSTTGTGIAMWDSGDLGIAAATGFTATAGTVSGGTAGGVVLLGARYFQTGGVAGTSIDNFSIGGVPTASFSSTTTNWTQYLTYQNAKSNPYRRLYVMCGINDLTYAGSTNAGIATNLTTIVQAAQVASPLTEVVLCAQHYGDVLSSVAAVTWSGTSGTVTMSSSNITTGFYNNPAVGSIITGPGIPVGVTVTVLTVAAGSMTVSVAGGSITAQTSVTVYVSGSRGGATNWSTVVVPSIAQVAITNGCTYINLYERFGNVSAISSVAAVVASGVSTITATCYGAKVGQAVQGPGIATGTTVASVTGTNPVSAFTLSIPTVGTTSTIYLSNDQYGLAQSANPDIHLGDANQSWSGRDGQRAVAETFLKKLAYSFPAQRPGTLQSAVPADGEISGQLNAGSQGGVSWAGYTNANDAFPVWQLLYTPGGYIPPGLFFGGGGAVGPDAGLSRAGAGIVQSGSTLIQTDFMRRVAAVTVTANAGTVAVINGNATFTNLTAAAMTITLATAGAIDGQTKLVRIYDATNAKQNISWNSTTEDSLGVPAPTTLGSAGSTTIPKVVGFIFNGVTSKWTCVAAV